MSAYAVKPGSITHAAASHTRISPAQASTPTTHLRLTRRGRAVFTTLAAVPLVLGAIGVALNGGMAAAEGTAGIGAAAFDYVTIEAGQSLWQLAETIAPSQDPRDVIADIVNLNQLASEAVQPGQRLALPADY
ncbi:LysM peptidoglycan-binding domain-containing protein [Cryobacterium sp. SO1]|uniref:LysM peptidoglycan-binding domain-containing protein n=1 Tax=Cryobacterium sp. SO1 TaxID=1897061 RepID=UPI001022E9B7|nr:LysM peptidoglycan-binding domain-containing protein [Cryobacterium sp. SO1]RZI37511.1 Cell division suppressor protein YneA [Cryobacterium sp. SO1]